MLILIIIFTVSIFTSCSSRPTDNTVTSNTVDSVNSKQTSNKMVEHYANSLRDINNFAIKVNCQPIDSLNESFTANKSFQELTKTNLCDGDCCTSFKKMVDNKSNSIFCFSKTDCGEYGFSNAQYSFSNNNLSIVRNFNLEIDQSSTDRTETLWSIKEKLFLFNNGKVIIKERRKLSTDNTNFTLDNIPFKETYGDFNVLLKEKTAEYNELISKK